MQTCTLIIAAAILALILLWISAKKQRRRDCAQNAAASATLLQAPLDAVTPELLAERRPILIEDRLVDPAALASSGLFRWQHVWRSGVEACRVDAFEATAARFTLIFYVADPLQDPESPPTFVLKAGEDDVAIRLVVGRVLVLPPGWRYLALSPGARRVRLLDLADVF